MSNIPNNNKIKELNIFKPSKLSSDEIKEIENDSTAIKYSASQIITCTEDELYSKVNGYNLRSKKKKKQ